MGFHLRFGDLLTGQNLGFVVFRAFLRGFSAATPFAWMTWDRKVGRIKRMGFLSSLGLVGQNPTDFGFSAGLTAFTGPGPVFSQRKTNKGVKKW